MVKSLRTIFFGLILMTQWSGLHAAASADSAQSTAPAPKVEGFTRAADKAAALDSNVEELTSHVKSSQWKQRALTVSKWAPVALVAGTLLHDALRNDIKGLQKDTVALAKLVGLFWTASAAHDAYKTQSRPALTRDSFNQAVQRAAMATTAIRAVRSTMPLVSNSLNNIKI